MNSFWQMDLGANFQDDGSVRFLVWAPDVKSLKLKLEGDDTKIVEMKRLEHGYYEAVVDGIKEGTDYLYLVNGMHERPDPVSRSQPNGVHGPSRVVNPETYQWNDHGWVNLPLDEYVIYELHIGTFTLEGSFYSAIEKLSYLRDLGITAVELMPVSSFPGSRNWGYDGVFHFSPQESYGGYSALKKFVDACHKNGLAVIMDVVYNHFGPEGNCLTSYSKEYFTGRYHTPWGDAINYDGRNSEQVRKYFLDNALYWKHEFHIDALRLDAVHAIHDASAYSILAEMHDRLIEATEGEHRGCYLIAESDLNDPIIIKSREQEGYGLDAQWNDDFHHAVQSYFIHKREAYFQDFGALGDIAKSFKEGYIYDGRWSDFRKKRHGHSSKGLSGLKFVNFLQNHDQIANASQGRTIGSLMSEEQNKVAALLLFFAPGIPLIFMGQEWASESPFYFFTSFIDPELQKAVSKGRKKEYAAWNIAENFVDPTSEEAFLLSELDWSWQSVSRHRKMFEYYRSLIILRGSHPCLRNGRSDLLDVEYSENERWMIVKRKNPDGGSLWLVCNFSHADAFIDAPDGMTCIFETTASLDVRTYAPWSAKVLK